VITLFDHYKSGPCHLVAKSEQVLGVANWDSPHPSHIEIGGDKGISQHLPAPLCLGIGSPEVAGAK
jgi:hypothetical protein